MDTLAHLYLAQENENPELQELTLNQAALSKVITAGFLGMGCVVGVLSVAEDAFAYGSRGCFRPCPPRPQPIHRPSYYNYSPGYYGSYDYSPGTPLPPTILTIPLPPPRPLPLPDYQPAAPTPSSESSVAAVSSVDTSYVDYSYNTSYADYSSGYVYHGTDGVASFGTYGEIVTTAQQRLQDLGYYTGEVDGLFGPLTYDAVIAYQRDQGLQLVDGIIGPETLGSLGSMG